MRNLNEVKDYLALFGKNAQIRWRSGGFVGVFPLDNGFVFAILAT
jgi:hypothetical protein